MSYVEDCLENAEVKILMNILRLSNTEAYLHSYDVANLVEQMLNVTDRYAEYEKEEIIKGAILHDIGKAFIPFNLTQLQASFTKYERSITQIHPILAFEIIQGVFTTTVEQICLRHHERMDGSGYPDGEDKIPDYVLLVQAADIYCALTTQRGYKESYTKEKAIEIMEKEVKQNQIDGYWVEILKQTI